MKKEKRKRNRKKAAVGPSKIPEGFLSIARRFIGGNGSHQTQRCPVGTFEGSSRPYGTGLNVGSVRYPPLRVNGIPSLTGWEEGGGRSFPAIEMAG